MTNNLIRGNILVLLSFLPIALLGQVLQENIIPTGTVQDTIRCISNPAQSYAVYLPTAYTPEKQWPVIFFYEPAARGKFPVTLYKSLAEKYGCILIGSNNSKNGPLEFVKEAEEAMLSDVSVRFSIDKKRLFVSGFSGGGRSAVFLTIHRKIYAGIISCGAAFPPFNKLTSEDTAFFVELVGNEDMNFIEAFEVETYLQSIKYPHGLLLFEGDHDWPPLDVYDIALCWNFNSLERKYNEPLNRELAYDAEIRMLSKTQQELDSGDLYMAHFNLLQFMKNSIDVSDSLRQLEEQLVLNSEFDNQEKEFKRILAEENERREEFFQRFKEIRKIRVDSAFDAAGWRTYIKGQNKLFKSKIRQKILMAKRLRRNMIVSCYEEYTFLFQAQDYFHASFAARIWSMIDTGFYPQFLLAKTYAAQGMKGKTLDALEKSVELGFANSRLLSNDPLFSFLQKERKFISLVEKIDNRKNEKGESR